MDASLKTPLMSANDPFITATDRLSDDLHNFQDQVSSLEKKAFATSAGETDIKGDYSGLQTRLTNLENFCGKLQSTLSNVANNRAKYAHIDDRELQRRTIIVADLTKRIAGLRGRLNSPDIKRRIEHEERQALHALHASRMEAEARKSSRYHNENSNFIANEQKQQLMIRQQQDAILDNMSKGITTLQEMARGIESELEMQSKMIDDVDNRVDEVQGKLDHAIDVISKLLKTKNKCQMATILILVVVLFIVTAIAFT